MCYVYMSCDDVTKHIKPLIFQFGSSEEYIVPPFEYLLVGDDIEESYAGLCLFGIVGSHSSWSVGKYLLGQTFLRSFYSIYDMEKNHVGLIVHRYSTATIKEPSIWRILFIVILVIIIGVLVWRIYMCYK